MDAQHGAAAGREKGRSLFGCQRALGTAVPRAHPSRGLAEHHGTVWASYSTL